MAPIFHILDRRAWADFQARGVYRPDSLGAEGFIHCSLAEQVAGVANTFYAGRPDLRLIEIDPASLGAALKYEPAVDRPGDYPHVYAPLGLASVVGVHALVPGEDGRFRWPPEEGQG
jgi:uncharacterized protein (DUF952 family)